MYNKNFAFHGLDVLIFHGCNYLEMENITLAFDPFRTLQKNDELVNDVNLIKTFKDQQM